VINGLWANALGKGGIIPIECYQFPAQNFMDLRLTGLQGDVMKESMNVAKTLAWKLTTKSKKKSFITESNKTKMHGIHIHCPEGATPKDGPSAGTAITTAIFSLLNGKMIKNNIAITGEINLQGKVTAIGGLKLKILGGIKAGVLEFIFPKDNEKDFKEFMEKYGEKDMVKNIIFHQVTNIQEVLTLVFV
jgi:ATP-dependent Lon protease